LPRAKLEVLVDAARDTGDTETDGTETDGTADATR
jgi:hypothetical protein